MTDSASLVFVVDDDDSVCRALARLIQSAGYRVETFGSARAFLNRMPADDCPACLVLDIQLPDLSGLELARELDPALPIIFITGHGDIAMGVGAMKAGATDFLPKPVSDTDLLRAIKQALARAVQTRAIRHELDSLRGRVERLTPREREVMALVVTGLLNKQVASELGTVEQTIKAHRRRVMAKMEATSLAQLIRIADKVGISGVA
ncbi:two component LuxR family transcriptional regulator [Paraburkholderia hospita]|uniref:Two component LuxR family transcriptional regulator n=2 Tax=Paraburkholderia hospita TaxID=169430 RepID=A0ABN0FB34_9BURK|nr:response regulator [Paraburkholderia hospita]EIM95854.1 two component LuxR family transcriptional regulator [Paraburkholderia hospita]